MNKKLITTLLILSFPMTTYALQPQRGDKSLPLKKYLLTERERMENDLDLNEVAKAKVEAIINDETRKFKASRDEKQTGLPSALTPEQMVKFDGLYQRHRYQLSNITASGGQQH